jgi:sortase A
MKRKRIAVFVLMASALVLIGDGCWIKAKAVLAQYLLRQAWQQTLRTGAPVKAWPWADTWPVARLRIKRLGVDAIVLEGQSGAVLAFGPGLLATGAAPNAAGNCVLAGHRDTSFRFLAHIKKGDILSLQGRDGKESAYKIVSTAVVRYDHLFLGQSARPWLTLITCYPFASPIPGGPLRFVAFAEGIGSEKVAVPYPAVYKKRNMQ